jgi:hypothetical protein
MAIDFKRIDFEELEKYEVVFKLKCPTCNDEEEFIIDNREGSWHRLDKYEKEIVEHGCVHRECEECHYEGFTRSYYGIKEDDGRYSPVDVYGIKGLL